MLDEAKYLVEVGFSVIWLKKASKSPYENDWANRPTYTFKELTARYREGDNMGVRLGQHSRIGDLYLYVVDMDIRDPKLLETAQKMLNLYFETDFEGFPTVISGSGGESRHFYLISSVLLGSKKVWHSEEKVFHDDGKWSWAAEIELFGTGKQVVLPPSIHPDTGKKYRWAEEFDLSKIPEFDADLLLSATGSDYDLDDGEEKEPLNLAQEEVRAALEAVQDWADDHETWRNVGMAVKHELGKDGFAIFDEWSKKGRGYNKGENRLQWRGFKSERRKTITMRTVMQEVYAREHAIDYEAVVEALAEEDDDGPNPLPKRELVKLLDDGFAVKKIKGKIRGVPEHLLTVPGALGMAVDHYNAVSKQDQPQFAVQTALALGSVVLGRYWKTTIDNLSSMYLVILGETGSGKEFTRTFLMKVLSGVNAGCLVGPADFTSEAAINAELASNPRNVTVIDEFGKVLKSTKQAGNTNSQDAQKAMLSLFGLLDGEFRPKRYSANGKSEKQVVAEKNFKVIRPAMTIVGMATPETFYDALSQEAVADGFMNRLLIVNTRMPLQLMRYNGWKNAPPKLNRWIKEHILPAELKRYLDPYGLNDGDDEAKDDDASAETMHPLGEHPFDDVPKPIVVEFTDAALARLTEINQWIVDERNRLKSSRVGGLWARAQEMAQRIALIVAISNDHQRITVGDVNWAWDYVKFYQAETIDNAINLMGSSAVVRLTNAIAELVEDAGVKGMTAFDIGRKTTEFAKLGAQDRREVLDRLSTFHDIVGLEGGGGRGNGGKTVRYFHKDFVPKRREERGRTSDRMREDLA